MHVGHVRDDCRVYAIPRSRPHRVPERLHRRALEQNDEEEREAKSGGDRHRQPQGVDVGADDGDAEQEDANGHFKNRCAGDVEELATPPCLEGGGGLPCGEVCHVLSGAVRDSSQDKANVDGVQELCPC